MRLVDFLDQSPALTSLHARFIDLNSDLTLTYREMVNVSQHIAALLIEKGVRPGDVVATLTPNSVANYCCIFALSRVKAVWLPLNTKNSYEATVKQLKQSDATLLFVEDGLLTPLQQLPEHFSEGRCVPINGSHIGGLAISSLVDEPARGSISCLQDATEDSVDEFLVSLFSTGGTTGDAKLAEWSNLTWKTMTSIQGELMPAPEIPACYLVSAPMTHAAGVGSFAPMLQGATIVVVDGVEPAVVLAAIESYQVTHLFLPPTAIYMLLAYEGVHDYDYSSLRYFWYAAAPMSVDKLKEAMATFGPVMIQTYGQAEAPMVCSCLSVEDHVEAVDKDNVSRMRSCGITSPHVEMAIIDDEGNVLPPGQEGEIVVTGDLLMRRYFNNPEATAAIRKEGGQRTGDIGVFDADGYLHIVDRKRDMIISGGFSIYPSETEQLLWGHPAVEDCAVIGLPDEKWGEQVTAVIELKSNAEQPDAQELIKYCKEKLGSIKAPKQILFWKELPRSSVGKVLKKEIRKYFWGDLDRKI